MGTHIHPRPNSDQLPRHASRTGHRPVNGMCWTSTKERTKGGLTDAARLDGFSGGCRGEFLGGSLAGILTRIWGGHFARDDWRAKEYSY